MVRVHGVMLQLPAFTRFCMALGPSVVMGLWIVASCYCLWIWCRKHDRPGSLVAFIATATAALFLVSLPVLVAIYLPLVAALQSLPAT
jgi:maltodextrin utilization protein YvdJ